VDEFLMPLAAALAWVVASSLKGTVLIGLVVILRHFLKVASAARLRYALWLPVLLGFLGPLGPSVQIGGFGDFAASSLFSPRAEPTRGESKPRASTTAAAVTYDPAHADAGRNRAVQPSTQRAYPPARARYAAALGWIAVVWMCGAATLSFVYLGHLIRYWRIRRGANPADVAIADAIQSCRTELRLRRKVLALESAKIDSPAIFGWWRPKLLLPLGLQRRIGSTALRHVILHELAHVKEHDVLVNWLGAATQMLHWFNPAVWLAMRCMRRDMEHACDARVLRHLSANERTDYGNMLIHLSDTNSAEPVATYGLGIADRHSDLKERLIMISCLRPTPNGAKLITGLALAGFASAALTQPSLAPRSQAASQTESSPTALPMDPKPRLADANPAANSAAQPRADGVPLQKLVEQVAANIHRRVIVDSRASSSVILYGQKFDQVNYSDFLTILRINGLTAVDINDYVNVVPITEVRWLPLPLMVPGKELPPDQVVDMAVVLKNACAPALAAILRPRFAPYAYVVADANSNSIMAMDTYANLKRIRTEIAELDSRTRPGTPCGAAAK
jgi:beta-lactamase regulating signal transducer with metallopeptidase domain